MASRVRGGAGQQRQEEVGAGLVVVFASLSGVGTNGWGKGVWRCEQVVVGSAASGALATVEDPEGGQGGPRPTLGFLVGPYIIERKNRKSQIRGIVSLFVKVDHPG